MILNNESLQTKCYGCSACVNACPKRCITMQENDEGFRFPKMVTDSCIDCGLCDKACPIGKPSAELRTEQYETPECYFCYALNNVVRKRSASGGMAFTISEYVISHGGVVFGVVGKWFEHVHHIMATTTEELIPTSNSKNIQSDIGNTYNEAKEQLRIGRLVLFTGTPCQIAGLYSILGKEYDNLLTFDLVCHGVPSQKILKAYIKSLEQKKGKKVISFGREKINQYTPAQYIVRFSEGSDEVLMPSNSTYRQGFLSNLFQRKSCYSCQYAAIPRIADFSGGDYFHKDLLSRIENPQNGVSLFLVNSPKGHRIFEQVKDKLWLEETLCEHAIRQSEHLSNTPVPNKLRARFFKKFNKYGYDKASKKVIVPMVLKARIRAGVKRRVDKVLHK